jgi:microcystin-dependent protein
MSLPYLGQITVFPYNFAPFGWADCAGQLLSISQNTALFSLLGTQFGGDGRTNFALPNLQGSVPVGQGTLTGGSPYDMGQTGGAENVSITSNSMPSHAHRLAATTAHGTTNSPNTQLLASPQAGTPPHETKGLIYNTAAPDSSLVPGSVGLAGGNQPHNNIQPFLVLRYCIAMQGTFPPRS